MKKWIFLLICLFVLGVCAACGNANEQTGKWTIAEESKREFTNTLQLHITEIELSENRVIYEIVNDSKGTYSCGTGADYHLEVLHNGVWHKMRGDPSWGITLESYTLTPGDSKEFTTSLRSDLPAGTYRFIKEVTFEGSPQSREFICCEFLIE